MRPRVRLRGTGEFNSRRLIGHPLLIAALRAVLNDRLLPIQLAISGLASLAAPLAYVLARRELQDDRAALLAGLGVALWPLFVRYSATLYSEPVALPLFTAFLLTMPPPGGRTNDIRGGRWFVAGMVLGLCMHYRPMYLLYSPLGALVAYDRGRRGKAGLTRVACLTAGCLALVLPWSVFMTLREGKPVLLTGEGGETIAGGLNPELLRIEREERLKPLSTPGGRITWIGPGKWLNIGETGYLSPEELQLPYAEKDRILTRRAVSWVCTHPAQRPICRCGSCSTCGACTHSGTDGPRPCSAISPRRSCWHWCWRR